MAIRLTVQATATNSAQCNVRCSTIRISEDSHDEKEQGFSADKT